jgi:hypothetical protein
MARAGGRPNETRRLSVAAVDIVGGDGRHVEGYGGGDKRPAGSDR